MKLSFRSGDIVRYGLVVAATGGGAGAQFILTLLMLRHMSEEAFGSVTILIVATQFAWAVGTSMFGAPLASQVAQSGLAQGVPIRAALGTLSLGFAVVCCLLATAIAISLGTGWEVAAVVGAFALTGGVRSFGRIAAYTFEGQARVVRSDLVYAGSILTGTALLVITEHVVPIAVFAVYALGNVACVLLLSPKTLLLDLTLSPLRTIAESGSMWRQRSIWSLIGIAATEATANAHSYLVSLVLGPRAYYPIAASAIVIRPGTVGINALAELERARIANMVDRGMQAEVRKALTLFRTFAVAGCCVSGFVGLLVFREWPGLLFDADRNMAQIVLGAELWLAVLLVRALYMPEAVAMQACGAFDRLAFPKIWSAPISLIGSALLLLSGHAILTLLPIILGEVISGILIVREAHRIMGGRQGGAARRLEEDVMR